MTHPSFSVSRRVAAHTGAAALAPRRRCRSIVVIVSMVIASTGCGAGSGVSAWGSSAWLSHVSVVPRTPGQVLAVRRCRGGSSCGVLVRRRRRSGRWWSPVVVLVLVERLRPSPTVPGFPGAGGPRPLRSRRGSSLLASRQVRGLALRGAQRPLAPAFRSSRWFGSFFFRWRASCGLSGLFSCWRLSAD